MSDDANDYEARRRENILKNKELLSKLALDKASLGAAPGSKASKKAQSASTPSKPRVKREKKIKDETPVPRRTSSRLAGINPDSVGAKRKAEDETVKLEEALRAKRQRVSGDLSFEIGRGLLDGMKVEDVGLTKEDVEKTVDGDLKKMREKMMGLKLYSEFAPNDIKITPERIYALTFHPTADKPLLFAGDKVGNLGIWDASSTTVNKKDEPAPSISNYKLHTRTISTLKFAPFSQALYSSSYDGSIRTFDLTTGKSTELEVTPDEDPLSGLEIPDANTLYFSTLSGVFGFRDLRQKKPYMFDLSDKKIGGLSIHPLLPHLAATASIDRTMKLYDLRRLPSKSPREIGSHTSRYSVSCAQWNARGSIATTSYDDTIKIYHFPSAASWTPLTTLDDVQPSAVIKHNNQTGRWVTILRSMWQERPRDGIMKFAVANMNRMVDLFNEKGEMVAQLGDEDRITAVPAVARLHERENWVAGGTASGKVALWM